MDVNKTVNKLTTWSPFILSMDVNKTMNKLTTWSPFILSMDVNKTVNKKTKHMVSPLFFQRCKENREPTKDKISLYSLNDIWFHSCKRVFVSITLIFGFLVPCNCIRVWTPNKYLQWVLLSAFDNTNLEYWKVLFLFFLKN